MPDAVDSGRRGHGRDRDSLESAYSGLESRMSFFGKFEAKRLEELYLRDSLQYDSRQAMVLVGVILLGTVLFISSDYRLFGSTPKFVWLLVMRCVQIAFSLIMLVVLRKSDAAPVITRALLCYSVVAAVFCVVVLSSRPPEYTTGNILVVLFIMSFYLALPLPLDFQVIPSLIISLGTGALLAVRPPPDHLSTPVVGIGIVLANVIGGYTSWQLHLWRRRQFAARIEETALRIELESAMAEIKTLRGIIPICSHCKRVREDVEEWLQVEEYVASHTDAQFSHSICPQCMDSQFGLKASR